MSFSSQVDLHPALEGFFKEQGLKVPTKIQRKVIPELLARKSIVVLSETGSGKTLAYALPVVTKIKEKEESGIKNTLKASPYALIIAPTRELAQQIHGVFKSISHHLKLRVREMSGGDSSTRLKSVASGSYEVLIATPTRIRSALQKGELSFNQLQFAIFDEADQLFDMGFKKDLDFITEYFDMNMVQLGIISATLPPEVENYIVEKFPEVQFSRIATEESHAPQARIETFNVRVSPAEKDMVVKMFLEKEAQGRGIIFTNQKNQAEDLFKYLTEKMPKLKVRLLHGDLEKKDRENAIRSFVEKKAQVLVATDIAARGIDIADLVWVVNYGLPKTGIYYLHRCGRVARGGRKGIVYNLVASHDSKMIAAINEAIAEQKHLQLESLPVEKSKPAQKTVPKKEASTAASFRGKTPPKGRRHGNEFKKPVRNRGIKRR